MYRFLPLLVLLLLAGCPGTPKPCDPPDLGLQSVVINDPLLLSESFSLRRTLQQIIDSSEGNPTTPEELLQSLLDSFNDSTHHQRFTNKFLPVDVRNGEANLDAVALLSEGDSEALIPIGLFNRFDLAPESASDCGEYRIVYGRDGAQPFFLIFEAKLPNTKGELKDCKPVTDLWASLSLMDPADAVNRLQSFYYDGISGFDPVVSHRNYGFPLGQVRSNFFVSGPWQLREHKLDFTPDVIPVFVPDSSKDAPLTEWFGPAADLPASVTAADQQAFRNKFLASVLPNLVRVELSDEVSSEFEMINAIGARSPITGDEMQSNSSSNVDSPISVLEPSFRELIQNKLDSLDVDLSVDQVVNRMGAMTCAGCHAFSNTNDIGHGFFWPNAGSFVHINSNGSLSNALEEFFLPKRLQIAREFSCPATRQNYSVGSSQSSEIFDEVDKLYEELIANKDNKEMSNRILERLRARVTEARAEDRVAPGAFAPIRRTH